jgi:hypothetical protein
MVDHRLAAAKLRRTEMLRPIVTSTVLGAVVGSVLAASVLFARADGPTSTVSIDNFSFGATDADSEGRRHRDLDQQGRHTARYRLVEQRLQEIAGARHRRQLFVHLHHAGDLSVLLLSTPPHGGLHRRRSDDRQQRYAMKLQSAMVRIAWERRWRAGAKQCG